jgi:hypothetical protein
MAHRGDAVPGCHRCVRAAPRQSSMHAPGAAVADQRLNGDGRAGEGSGRVLPPATTRAFSTSIQRLIHALPMAGMHESIIASFYTAMVRSTHYARSISGWTRNECRPLGFPSPAAVTIVIANLKFPISL